MLYKQLIEQVDRLRDEVYSELIHTAEENGVEIEIDNLIIIDYPEQERGLCCLKEIEVIINKYQKLG